MYRNSDCARTEVRYSPKYITRLEKRVKCLEYRIEHYPKQADFGDERGEVKALKWAIKELNKLDTVNWRFP